jgi:hypothetical protein
MRLFHQATLGDWDGLFARIAAEVEALIARRGQPRPIHVELSPGELIDRITRREVEGEQATAAEDLAGWRAELAILYKIRDAALAPSEELTRITAGLKATHQALARAAEELRQYERTQDFGPGFIELACLSQRRQEERAALIEKINIIARRSGRKSPESAQ